MITELHYTHKGEHPEDRIFRDREYIKNVLANIIHIEDAARQTGRTTSIVEAAKQTNNPFVVVHNEDMKQLLEKKYEDIKFTTFNELKDLQGIKRPAIFVDNAALYNICYDALCEIVHLEQCLEKTRKELNNVP